jgi:Methyltransferase FkbM domain
LFPFALGEADERRRYFPPRTSNQGSGSFVEDWFNLNDKDAPPIFLDVRNGDEFLESANISGVGIVKIDVEGSEASVCRGLKKTIQRDRPFVLLEISGHAARDFASERSLRGCLYDDAHFFRLSGGRHRTHLQPYCFDESLSNNTSDLAEVMIVPPEQRERFTSSFGRSAG